MNATNKLQICLAQHARDVVSKIEGLVVHFHRSPAEKARDDAAAAKSLKKVMQKLYMNKRPRISRTSFHQNSGKHSIEPLVAHHKKPVHVAKVNFLF